MVKQISNTIIPLVLIVLFASACVNERGLLNTSFEEKYKRWFEHAHEESADSMLLNVSNLTSFSWDTLYIFRPYTSIDEINETIKTEWNSAHETLIDQSDDFNLYVFIEDNDVKHYARIPRNCGDFVRTRKLKFDNSVVFLIRKEMFGDQEWYMTYNNEELKN